MNIETIVDSYINGNHKQMREQIQKYGVKLFFYDVMHEMTIDPTNSYMACINRYMGIYGTYYGFRS